MERAGLNQLALTSSPTLLIRALSRDSREKTLQPFVIAKGARKTGECVRETIPENEKRKEKKSRYWKGFKGHLRVIVLP